MSDTHVADMAGTCPSEEDLFAFMDGEMDAERQVLVLRHLSNCEACRQSIMELAATQAGILGTLRASEQTELPIEEMDALEDRIVSALQTSGEIRRAKGRLDAGALARALGQGAVRGTRVAAAALVGGVKVAYTGVVATSRVAGGAIRVSGRAGKAASWIVGHSPWRLAW